MRAPPRIWRSVVSPYDVRLRPRARSREPYWNRKPRSSVSSRLVAITGPIGVRPPNGVLAIAARVLVSPVTVVDGGVVACATSGRDVDDTATRRATHEPPIIHRNRDIVRMAISDRAASGNTPRRARDCRTDTPAAARCHQARNRVA